MIYLDFNKKDVDLKSLQKDAEKFEKLTSKIDGSKFANVIEQDDYYEVWIEFELRTLFNIRKSLHDKEIHIDAEGRIDDMPLNKACSVFTDWAEIFNAIDECFGKYL